MLVQTKLQTLWKHTFFFFPIQCSGWNRPHYYFHVPVSQIFFWFIFSPWDSRLNMIVWIVLFILYRFKALSPYISSSYNLDFLFLVNIISKPRIHSCLLLKFYFFISVPKELCMCVCLYVLNYLSHVISFWPWLVGRIFSFFSWNN